MIGTLQYIGEENGGIESKVLGSTIEYPKNIVDWNYHTFNGWVFYNGNDDIVIECIDSISSGSISSGSISSGSSSNGHSISISYIIFDAILRQF